MSTVFRMRVYRWAANLTDSVPVITSASNYQQWKTNSPKRNMFNQIENVCRDSNSQPEIHWLYTLIIELSRRAASLMVSRTFIFVPFLLKDAWPKMKSNMETRFASWYKTLLQMAGQSLVAVHNCWVVLPKVHNVRPGKQYCLLVYFINKWWW